MSRIFVAACFILLLASCDKDVVFEKNISIPDYKWDMNNIVTLEADIKDTLTPCNIYLNIRNGSGYQFSNLFLFLNTTTPSGKVGRDTVELMLADESGRWLGDGLGDIRDSRILFKRNYKFPEAGVWKFGLQQAMRVNPLPFIADAGVRIERAK